MSTVQPKVQESIWCQYPKNWEIILPKNKLKIVCGGYIHQNVTINVPNDVIQIISELLS